MELLEYKEFLKKLLLDDISAVLANLLDSVKQNSNTYDEVIILNANFNMHERKRILGHFSNEEENIFLAKFTYGIIEFINSLSEDDLIKLEWLNHDIVKPDWVNPASKRESFKEEFQKLRYWNSLEKIGRWQLNEGDSTIIGQGVYQFLLSNHNYGEKDFTIYTSLKFENYKKFESKGIDNANAGIVLGWVSKGEAKMYYNLLFTGNRILLEGVGLHGGDDYKDFVHLDNGVAFTIEDGVEYRFTLRVSSSSIDLFVNDEHTYSIKKPQNLIGKVGLRPWRSKLMCNYFEVTEK